MQDKFDFRSFVIYGFAIKTYKVVKGLNVTFKFGSLYQLRKLLEKDLNLDDPEQLAPYVYRLNEKICTVEDLKNLPEPVFKKIGYLFSEFLKELLKLALNPPENLKIDFAEVLLFMYPRFLAEFKDSNYDISKFNIEVGILSLAAAQFKQIIYVSNIIPMAKEGERAFKLLRDFQTILFPLESDMTEKEMIAKIKSWENELAKK